jgi:YggT family protein
MDIFLLPFFDVLGILLTLYTWLIIGGVIINWLVAFQVLDPYRPVVSQISQLCYSLTEPVYARIRQFVPLVGTIDLSPLILLLGIRFAHSLLAHAATRFML